MVTSACTGKAIRITNGVEARLESMTRARNGDETPASNHRRPVSCPGAAWPSACNEGKVVEIDMTRLIPLTQVRLYVVAAPV
jgi:hypothetical protein